VKLQQVVLSFALLLAFASLSGCAAAAGPMATPPAAAYSDPFAYCAAVGTIDAPDATYTGLQVPQSVAEGLQKALNAPDTPLEMLQNGSSWRCMDGEVYACFVGANLPCEARANTDRAPTQEEIDFCKQSPNSDFIPAVLTGRETVYEWRCRNGAPEIVRQVFQPDAQGFLSEIWYVLSSTPSESTVAAGSTIQPLVTEVCNGQAQAISHTLNDLIPTQSNEPLDDPVTNAKGTGCQATVTGTGVQFESPAAAVNALSGMLQDEGWTVDPMLIADGPTGTAAGYRKGDQICIAAALWEPDDSAICPQDQPISACQLKPEQQIYTVTLNCGVETPEEGTLAEGGSGQPEPTALDKWQTYANREAGFRIQMPLTWILQTLPDQNNGAIHGESFTGPEGGVEIYWGVGLGGACPTAREPIKLAEVEVTACHATSSDGTEAWSQIDYLVSGGNAFSNRAYTSNAQPSSHDLVLQVLSTLAFMPPE